MTNKNTVSAREALENFPGLLRLERTSVDRTAEYTEAVYETGGRGGCRTGAVRVDLSGSSARLRVYGMGWANLTQAQKDYINELDSIARDCADRLVQR